MTFEGVGKARRKLMGYVGMHWGNGAAAFILYMSDIEKTMPDAAWVGMATVETFGVRGGFHVQYARWFARGYDNDMKLKTIIVCLSDPTHCQRIKG